jgi:hypothetical protein
MSATEDAGKTGSVSSAIRPFQVGFPEADLAELRPDNLLYYNRLDRGGHFAAWEQPQLFSEEMRAAFRTLR